MKISHSPAKRLALQTSLAGILIAASSVAMADTYNIILKNGAAALACATGGFTYTHTPSTPPGSYPVTAPSVNVSANCFTASEPGAAVTFNQNSTIQAVLANTTSNTGDNQGSNLVGITGSLRTVTTGSGSNAVFYTMTFTSGPRTFTVTKTTGTGGNQSTTTVVNGQPYDARNTISAVPEPETALLALMGLGALMLARRRRG